MDIHVLITHGFIRTGRKSASEDAKMAFKLAAFGVLQVPILLRGNAIRRLALRNPDLVPELTHAQQRGLLDHGYLARWNVGMEQRLERWYV